MLGVFASVNPFLVDVDPSADFNSLLRKISRLQKADFRHQKYPIGAIIRDVKSNKKSRLYDVVFNYLKTDYSDLYFGTHNAEVIYSSHNHDPVPLTFTIWDGDSDDIEIQLDFNMAYFNADEIDALTDRFHFLFQHALENHALPIQELSIITQQEFEKYSLPSVSVKATFLQSWSEQVNARNTQVAVRSGDESWCYGELEEQANRVANWLSAQGVQKGDVIGVCLERSLPLMSHLLGCLKVGAAYLPLDPSYPEQRLQYMLSDSQAQWVLVDDEHPAFKREGVKVFNIASTDYQAALFASASEYRTEVKAGDLAYLIYTSGSTGQPKGVMVSHGNVANFLMSMQEQPGCQVGDRLLAVTPISFDIHVLELFLPLISGAEVVLCRREDSVDGARLSAQLAEHEITMMQATPMTWRLLLDSGEWPTGVILKALCGGERLAEDLASRLLERVDSLWNMYGPTETTVWSTCARLTNEGVSIGYPIANTQCYVLSESRELLPRGVSGELYIGGAGVTQGYWQREALTAERYCDNPFVEDGQERMYRTGDRVRYLADGRLHYEGRVDEQVKLRGQRIEPGEIESVLVEHEGLRSAVVTIQSGAGEDDGRLVAYVVLADKEALLDEGELAERLRDYLEPRLPLHLIPSAYAVLEALPLTPNGKVDKRALPAIAVTAESDYVAPSGATETELATLWATLLQRPVESISATANFFELGGHSLLAVQLANGVEDSLHRQLSIRHIFEHPELRRLAQFITSSAPASSSQAIPAVTSEHSAAPLSYAQQRLWLIDQLQGNSAEYNMPAALRLKGTFDREIAQGAVQAIMQRHRILRSGYRASGEGAEQYVRPEGSWVLSYHDLRGELREEQPQRLKQLLSAEMETPFDLTRDLPVRVSYVQLSDEEEDASGVLLFTLHHIAADGWSVRLLIEEFMAYYAAGVTGAPAALRPLSVQYSDYAVWQRTTHTDSALAESLGYWTKQLAGVPQAHNVPLDRPRPSHKQYQGGVYRTALSAALLSNVQALAHTHQMTLFMVLHGVVNLVLARHSNEREVIIGTPVANRMRAELAPLIGCFVNTLVLRGRTDFASVTEYFEHIRQVNLDAQMHQDVPFEQLLEQCSVERSLQHTPLFQLMLRLEEDELSKLTLPGLSITPVALEQTMAKFDLDINVRLLSEGAEFEWHYDESILTAEHVAQLSSDVMTLLQQVVQQPNAKLAELSMLSAQAEAELMALGRGAPLPSSAGERCLHQWVEAQVAAHPERIAVRCASQSLTYQQLNAAANRLAHYLRAEGVDVETPVGISLTRTSQMVVALLGVLKAGGSYVALDPNYPSERLAYIVEDTELSHVLCERKVEHQVAWPRGVKLHLLDELGERLAEQSDSALEVAVQPEHLAYLIYTSGSTGRPKGVMIEHRSASSLLAWSQDYYRADEMKEVLASTSLNFDLSVFEVFAPLSVGGSCRVVDSILSVLEDDYSSVSLINTVPSGMEALVRAERVPATVQTINLAGEPLSGRLVNELLAQGSVKRVVNLYGPSEDTTYSTVKAFESEQATAPSIGRAVSGTHLYVLDKDGQLAPRGVIGELYIGGAGLARGYLNQPSLTNERFISAAFTAGAGSRLYRTGDWVRYNNEGDLEFLGRADEQVKIRGFRVELGEVQHQLLSCAVVSDGVVIAQEGHLVAYVVLAEGADEVRVREYMKQRLPDYMQPSRYGVLEALPLTPNGKVDKRALPAITVTAESDYVAPSGATETELATLWATLLQRPVESISATANFFELGGHSLLAVQLANGVEDSLHRQLSIRHIFEHPELRRLAQFITSSAPASSSQAIPAVTSEHSAAPLSYAQQRLWLIDQLQGNSAEYNMPAALRLKGTFDREIAQGAIQAIMQRHRILRSGYRASGEGAEQYVRSEGSWVLSYHDLRGELREEQPQRLKQLLSVEMETPFDLTRDLPVRVSYVQLSDEEEDASGVLLFTLHHIAADGWSVRLLIEEFMAYYAAGVTGAPAALRPLSVQYSDYAVWQRTTHTDSALAESLGYWTKQLAGVPQAHNVPLDRPRPSHKQYQGGVYRTALSAALLSNVQALAHTHQMTLFMVLHGVVNLVLARHSNEREVIIGTPVANRMRAELAPLIGCFVNTLVLRGRTDFASVTEYFEHIRQVNLDAQMHQDVPFEQLLEQCSVERSLQHTPLFQLMLRLEEDELSKLTLPGLSVTPVALEQTMAKFDLDINVRLLSEGAEFEWHYDESILTAEHVAQLSSDVMTLLQQVVQQPNAKLAELSMLSAQAEAELMALGRGAPLPSSAGERCLHQWVEAQVAAHPERIAVRCASQSLTYQQLNAAANRLAHYLRAEGVDVETPVGISLTRTSQMVVALLGVLKAGGSYVALDPNYPSERLAYIVEDTELSHVLCERKVEHQVAWPRGVKLHLLDELGERLAEQSDSALEVAVQPEHLAYLIYTSGSTGRPKGVMIEHRSASSLLAWSQDYYRADEMKEVLASTSLNFDLSVFEVFAPLSVGGSCRVVDSILSVLEDDYSSVSLINTVPSGMEALVRAERVPATVQTINLAGEPLSGRLVNELLAQGSVKRVVNLYGPSEDTTYSTVKAFESEQATAPSIGRAVSGTHLYVLDKDGQLAPRGVIGELYIGGAGLARGYLNQPSLTNERFISAAFTAGAGSRLYRTGDWVRYNNEGDLEFLGRADEQVKIRGFRVELGEVQHQLLSCAVVSDGVVIAQEGHLVAYVVLAEGADEVRVREYMKQRLPDYMQPSRYGVLEALPLTPNGKVDKRALPAIAVTAESDYVAPSGATETELATLWATLLQRPVESISATANFFELGGHSLLAVQLANGVEDSLNRQLSIRHIFEHPELRRLAQFITSSAPASSSQAIPAVTSEHSAAPLSYAQQRLWLIDQLQGNSAEYNMPAALRLKGTFDREIAQGAIQAIMQRHRILRSGYRASGEGAEQYVRSEGSWVLSYHDLRGELREEQPQRLKQLLSAEMETPFDLTRDLPVRVSYVQLSDEEEDASGVLLFTLHHIAADGWSVRLLIEEFMAYYAAGVTGAPAALRPLSVQYSDYAVWQRTTHTDSALAESLGYWTKQLAGVPQAHNVPLDRPRPSHKQYQGGVYRTALSAALLSNVQALAHTHQMTLFMVLHGVVNLVLARHSNEREVIIGTPVANRMRAELAPLIGCFVNTLVLRGRTDFASVTEYFEHIRQVNLDAQMHQDVPFEQLLEQCSVERSLQHTPLFQLMLRLEEDELSKLTLPGLSITPVALEQTMAKFDLDINVRLLSEGAEFEWHYDESILTAEHVAQLSSDVMTLLQQVVQQPNAKLAELSMLSAQAEAELMALGRGAPLPSSAGERCLHQWVEAQVAAHPERIAVRCASQSLTYQQLNAAANRLAHYLRAEGVDVETPVGISLTRTSQMVVALLGVLKAGGSYVALDPNYPSERLAYIVEDTELSHVLCERKVEHQVAWPRGVKLHLLDELGERLAEQSDSALEVAVQPEHLAYLIYTSGSTGRPKGVMIEHRSASSLLAWSQDYYRADEMKEVLASTSLNFDLSVFEVFAPLSVGGSCRVVDSILSVLEDDYSSVSLINTVPSGMEALVRAERVPATVQTINLAGEPLSGRLVNELLAQGSVKRVVNLYGPSEDTTYSTVKAFESEQATAPSIGRAVSGTHLYVLDKDGQLAPRGVIGELYIGGAGLARGYLNQPSLTNERFISAAFTAGAGSRLYRTGDWVRYNTEGDLEFLGRADEQVKIRGFRVELGEVQHQLLSCAVVSDGVVIAQEGHLVAYVVLAEGADEVRVREYMKQRLPDYMQPSRYGVLEALPLTPNGKVDKRALPAITVTAESDYVAPSGATETELATLWATLLQRPVESISATANFFELGGHSLLAVQVSKTIYDHFKVNISLKELFDFQNIKDLGTHLDYLMLLKNRIESNELDNQDSLEEIEW
ncbi:non-ribosomal peptide synthetase [Pleionea litopenaei]|uniref:Amino acid adenylation domain-containing protein n=1 Tax=Pleionea litopenaei TaxID=3070815 RepID=A0AA51RTN9_9GAMM|nr:non-ribosomal peptide synthetase [Pleionea sp. HL-JVS1]WMS87320.1 amino acid adenylation domain-containing protein [Pleionea sp. HL-JVS1]